jgi:hypothetical protein
MSQSIERIENLIRVLHGLAPGELDMSRWCGCAVGRASRDRYFVGEGLSIEGLGEAPMTAAAEFFGISGAQSYKLPSRRSSRQACALDPTGSLPG